jgi:hypothetical protein
MNGGMVMTGRALGAVLAGAALGANVGIGHDKHTGSLTSRCRGTWHTIRS